MFLAISDFWINIGEAIEKIWQNIGDWNWDNILQYFQNVSLPVIFGVGFKFIYPIIKNSNSKQLKAISKQLEILKETKNDILSLTQEDRTVKNLLTKWIELQSEINVKSRTLTDEEKQRFIDIASGLKEIDNEKSIRIAEKIESAVEDNIITSEEAIDIASESETIEKIFGTNIDDIVPSGDK